jgi:hypothetical protein
MKENCQIMTGKVKMDEKMQKNTFLDFSSGKFLKLTKKVTDYDKKRPKDKENKENYQFLDFVRKMRKSDKE